MWGPDRPPRAGRNQSNVASGFQDKAGRYFLVQESETCPRFQEMRKLKTLRVQPKGHDLWVSFSARAAEPGAGHGRALATMSPAVCRP